MSGKSFPESNLVNIILALNELSTNSIESKDVNKVAFEYCSSFGHIRFVS